MSSAVVQAVLHGGAVAVGDFTDSAESMESGEESEGLDSSDVEQEGLAGVGMCVGTAGMDAVVPQGPAGIDAVRPQCM